MLFAVSGYVFALGMAAAAYARYFEPKQPRLERIEFRLPEGAGMLDGLTIGFLTDLHYGPFTSLKDIERGISLVMNERPDLLLLGGDYHSESPRYLDDIAELLGAFARQVPLGCLGVMGNHDYAVSGEPTFDAFAATGFRLLRNEAASVDFNGTRLWIAGIDDTLLGNVDTLAAFAPVPEGEPVIALWHEPLHAEQSAALGAFAQLSGHTHGGQVRLPLIGPLALPKHGKRFTIGLNDASGMPVYTSRGLGMYRPPVRLNCPPEVTLVTLVAGNQSFINGIGDCAGRGNPVG